MSNDNNATPVLNSEEERRENLTSNLTGLSVTPSPGEKKKGRFARRMEEKKANEEVEPAQAPAPTYQQSEKPKTNQSAGDQKVLMSGKIVGANANEPDWSREQLEEFARLCAFKIDMMPVSESRKTKPDPRGFYVQKRPDGSTTATTNAMLPNLAPTEFKLGVGQSKRDDKLPQKKMYSDVVIVGKDRDWLLTQWLCKGVIMEPVPSNIRHRQHQPKNRQAERTIGVNFARFGLPVESFGAVFNTLAGSMPGLLDSVVITDGYYWVNASWGVSTTPGTFAYLTENKQVGQLQDLSQAMEMIGTKSSYGIGTFAISLSCDYEIKGDKAVPNPTKYSFSIKCHNFFHLKKTDWHGPPQTTAVGFTASDDLLQDAETLSKPAVADSILGSTSGLFGAGAGGGLNPFATNNAPTGEYEKETTGGSLL